MERPQTDEYFEYYDTYISKVDGNDCMPKLRTQSDEIRDAVAGLDEKKGTYRYGEDKWTIKEVLSHLIDAERIFAYRILRIAREDKTPIEGFEQDGYIENSNANNRTFADLLDEFDLQRRSNLLMLNNISDEASKRMGTASDKPVSVRALAYISAGHVEHHLQILKERYLA